MFDKIRNQNIFAKSFSFGLLLLFADVLKQTQPAFLNFKFFNFDTLPFFAIGVTVCLISLLFLLTEWVMLPYGTHVKRIKLYQGAGNLFAFAVLVFGSLSENSMNKASLAFSSSGLLLTIVFAWLGKPIADFYSRKKIAPEMLKVRNALRFSRNRPASAEV